VRNESNVGTWGRKSPLFIRHTSPRNSRNFYDGFPSTLSRNAFKDVRNPEEAGRGPSAGLLTIGSAPPTSHVNPIPASNSMRFQQLKWCRF